MEKVHKHLKFSQEYPVQNHPISLSLFLIPSYSCLNFIHFVETMGHVIAQLVAALRCKPLGRGFIYIILPAAVRLWGRLSLQQTWVPGVLPEGKGGRRVWLTLPPSCADCLEIWQPQPPGTPRACRGIALPYFGRHCEAYQWTPYRYEHPSSSVIFAWIMNFSAASAFHAMLIFIVAQYKNAYGRCAVSFSLIQLANQTCSTNWLRHLTQVLKPRVQYHSKICL